VEVNQTLSAKPETVNGDPHGTWLFVLELSTPSQLEHLLTSNQYADLVK
jgi:glycine cleavage system H lipoate-binding protein